MLLVVADAQWVINDVRASLGVGDWVIEVVPDPYQAATVVSEMQPQAVVIDMQIGEMGGMAVIRDIKARLEGGDRPHLVLLLDRTADSFLAKRAGADAWVVKPFGAHDFRKALSG